MDNSQLTKISNLKSQISNDKGQVILILILIMTVALSIGLSIVQKSLVDVSTSSKVEQSSRAFSAAEAGVEKALTSNTSSSCTGATCPVPFDNSSNVQSIADTRSPADPGIGNRQAALEFPPLAKEDVAQVWLADPTSNLPNCDSGKICYTQNTLDIYWGNSPTDYAAIEVTLIYYGITTSTDDPVDPTTPKYRSHKWYLDNPSAPRTPANGFDNSTPVCAGGYLNTYRCRKTLDFSAIKTVSPSAVWMLLRVRLLYNSTSQPFAVRATGVCVSGCSLPPQARTITSTGVSGETQRKINIFQLDKVVPPYFDYAIFSAGAITK